MIAFVLSGNTLTLLVAIIGSATTLTVAIVTQGRRARQDREEIERKVVAGYLDTVQRVDDAHDELRTGNGKSAGKYVVDIAGAFEAHRLEDASNFGEVRGELKALRRAVEGRS